MRYKYFVSFAHKFGFGNWEISIDKKIDSIETIHTIEKFIEEKGGARNVAIISWKMFEEE